MGRWELVALIGLATAVLRRNHGALAQTDIKKVFAYSTVSQLGYMFVGLGTGAFSAGIFHVMTHAFFKALLFLGAGSVIHACSGEQDPAQDGRTAQIHADGPAVTLAVRIAWLISGFPFCLGLSTARTQSWRQLTNTPWMYWVGVFTAGNDSFLRFPRILLAFSASLAGKSRLTTHGQDASGMDTASPTNHHLMWIPLAVLAVLIPVGATSTFRNG